MWSLFNRRKRSSSNGLKQAAERSRAFEARSLQIDTLEQRSVPALTVTNLTDVVNISKRSGNDAEAAITVNPNDPISYTRRATSAKMRDYLRVEASTAV